MKPSRLAVSTDISKGYVSGLLSGSKVNPSIETCVKFADVLGCSPVWLFDGSEASGIKNAESYANPNESGIGESANVLREDSPIYKVGIPEERLREVSQRDEEIMVAFKKIREGLDLLEEMMKKGHR